MTAVKVRLNGKEKEIRTGTTLTDLLQELGIPPERVACEVNLRILKRIEYASCRIQEGDEIEILQMIGGG